MITEVGKDISKAAELLTHDELVAIPTETVYGLAGNALSEISIAKIYAAKQRPSFNPLIMHVASRERITEYAEVDELSQQIIERFMPGPLTILLKKKNNVPDLLTAGSDKVAIRIPQHPVTQQLLNNIHFPLAAPSANPSGYISPVTAQHVSEGLDGKIAYILDGGQCTVGLESTIVEVKDGTLIIHRVGGTSIDALQELGSPISRPSLAGRPQTSGQLKSHYAPATPLYVGDIEALIKQHAGKKTAVISLSKNYDRKHVTTYELSPKGDIIEAASRLFEVMRMTDKEHYDVILAEIFPEAQLGAAINDRLGRAQFVMKQ